MGVRPTVPMQTKTKSSDEVKALLEGVIWGKHNKIHSSALPQLIHTH